MLLWAESPQLLSLKRICSYWIQKSCFWAWIRSRYFESDLWLLSCLWAWIRCRYFESGLWFLSSFWAWIRSRYFESGLWLLSCFWAWIRSRYLESDLYLLSSSAHRSSNFVINTRFSLVIRSTWVSETYSYSWYCLAVPALHLPSLSTVFSVSASYQSLAQDFLKIDMCTLLLLRSCLWVLQHLQTRNRNLVSLQRFFMACGFRKRRCGMKFCNAYRLKFSMESEGRICLLYDIVLRYIFHGSFYEVITNLWLPFSSVFCSSVVLVSVFLFLSNRTWFHHLLLNASSGLCITKSPVKWNATGCRNLVWVSWRRIVLPLFFFCCSREARRSRSFQTLWSWREDVAMH